MIKNLFIKAHIKVKTVLSNNRGAINKEEIIGIAIAFFFVVIIATIMLAAPMFNDVVEGLGKIFRNYRT